MKNNGYKKPNYNLLRAIQRYFANELKIKTQRKDYRRKDELINWLHIHSQYIFSYVSMRGCVKIEYADNKYITLQSTNDQQIDSLIMKIKNMHIKPQSKPLLKPTFESRICKFNTSPIHKVTFQTLTHSKSE